MSKFFIPEVKPPTAEKMRESSLGWLAYCRHTLYDNWPDEYKALSIPTELIKVDVGEMREFWGHDPMPTPYAIELAAILDDAIGWETKFLRLNSRSPKDACYPLPAPMVEGGKQAVGMIAGSERCLDDVCRFFYVPEQPLYICLREWVYGMKLALEYRCFVKGGDLIAVTAYDYTDGDLLVPGDEGASIRATLDAYFAEKIKPSLPCDDLVFDVLLQSSEPLLIEINPYGLSDPCFFKTYAAVEAADTYVQYSTPSQKDHPNG